MASLADDAGLSRSRSTLAANGLEKLLSIASVVLLIAVITALAKGQHDWGWVPLAVWLHLSTIMLALILTPVMLLRPRGDRLHRALGRVWAGSMFLTALISFAITDTNSGRFSFIHILSVWTVIQVPVIVWHARHHNIARHRSAVRGMVTGALLIAGFFTFPFNRMLGQWLFS